MAYPGPPPPSGMGGNGGPPCGPMRGPPPHSMMDQGPPGPGGQQMPPGMMRGGVMKGPGGYPPSQGGPLQPQSNDPAYAEQFHHFQQSLYATGTNNGRNTNMLPLQNNPNTPPNQQFFK